MKAVVKLIRVPESESDMIRFQVTTRDGKSKTYVSFGMNKGTNCDCELKENGLYLIDFSASYGKDKDTEQDYKMGRLSLKNVTDKGFDIKDDESYLGLSVIKGIVTELTKFTIEGSNKEQPGIKSGFTFYRVRLQLQKTGTYLGYYNELVDFEKGDMIRATVKLFAKRAYDEQGLVDMNEKHTYKDSEGKVQSRGYTELDLISASVIS